MELHLRSLGGTLRAVRVERGYSLGDVAAGTGLSTSFLSLVENGRSDISTGRLYRLARFLDVGLGDLLGMDPLREPTIVRGDAREAVDVTAEGLHMFPLVNAHDGVAMAPVISVLDPGARVAELERTEGVEYFVLVMEGALEVCIEGLDPVRLATGDSMYFGLGGPRELRNAGEDRAVTLWVTSPPVFGGTPPA